jgi:hypothetical protein
MYNKSIGEDKMTKIKYLIPKIYGMLGYKTYYSFSYQTLDLILSEHYKKWNFNPFNYYEFGTGEGKSLKYFLKALKMFSKNLSLGTNKFNLFLFDSFEGLPEYSDSKDKNPAWEKGQFMGNIDKIKSITNKYFQEAELNVKFVKGYYENSLTQVLKKTLIDNPPSIVNIDVDYYSSTKTVLNWIYPICQDGTIFYFDDIYEYLGNLSKGEYKAIDEFNRDHLKEGYQLYHFYNFGIPSYTGKIYTLNRVEGENL